MAVSPRVVAGGTSWPPQPADSGHYCTGAVLHTDGGEWRHSDGSGLPSEEDPSGGALLGSWARSCRF